MSLPDSGDKNSVDQVSGPTNKTFHYVLLPRVVLERIDKQAPHANAKTLRDPKKLVSKKPVTKPVQQQKPMKRNSPRINSLPEKRRIKLTNKGEDTLHIVARGNSGRTFIVAEKGEPSSPKHNSETVKQYQNAGKKMWVKNVKTVQKPLLTVRNKTEINMLTEKNDKDSKCITSPIKREISCTRPVVQLKKVDDTIRISKNLQNVERVTPSLSNNVKQNSSVVQLNKNVEKKQIHVINNSSSVKHDTGRKEGSPVRIQVNKSLQSKQKNVSPSSTNTVRTENQKTVTIQINKNLQSKQNKTVGTSGLKHYVSSEKLNTGMIQVSKSLHSKQNEISPNAMKQKIGRANEKVQNEMANSNVLQQNITVAQVNKNLHSNKQNKVVSAKAVTQAVGVEKQNNTASVTQDNISVSTPGTNLLKHKLPDEHDYHSTKLQRLCETSASVDSGTREVSSHVNVAKQPLDRKTAKVTPLAKARKSITLPRPDVVVKVNEKNKSDVMSSRSRENLEAFTLLSKLVGTPIEADKVEVLLCKGNDNRQILINKNPGVLPTSKKSQGTSNLSKLLSDSLKPSTSAEVKSTTTPTKSTSPIPSTSSSSSSSLIRKTMSVATATASVTTTTAAVINTTVMPSQSDHGNKNVSSPISCDPTFSSAYAKPPSVPVNSSSRSSSGSVNATQQAVATKHAVDVVAANDRTKQKSQPPQCDSPIPEEIKTIYDVMREVAAMFPAWNMHILEDTNTFCIAHIDRDSNGFPFLSKCIELDEVFNARVCMRQYHCKQFDGVYNNEASILALLEEVDRLKPDSVIK